MKDGSGQKLAYDYYEEEPGRRSAAKMLAKDEAEGIARGKRRSGHRVVRLTFCDRRLTLTSSATAWIAAMAASISACWLRVLRDFRRLALRFIFGLYPWNDPRAVTMLAKRNGPGQEGVGASLSSRDSMDDARRL